MMLATVAAVALMALATSAGALSISHRGRTPLYLAGGASDTEGLPKDKRILVTGGAGFIGFHTSMSLYNLGNTVVALDNFNDYYDVKLKEARAHRLYEAGVKVVNGDICNVDLLESLFAEHDFDAVVNLAAQAGVRYSVEHPHTYVKNNVDCFVNILEILRFRADKTTLVYASSSSVYGKGASIPFTEKECSDHPTNVYGATKRMNELLAHAYHHLYNVSSTGLRFFTVYGPWGRPDMAPYIFTDRILRGASIDVYHTEDGRDMRRDFTYVEDIADGIMRAVEKRSPLEVFNLGRGEPTSVPDYIKLIEGFLEKEANQRKMQAHDAELPLTFADVSHAKEVLNYEPQISARRGVELFTSWFKWWVAKGSIKSIPDKTFYLPKE